MFKKFKKNDNYFAIAIYAFLVIAASIALIWILTNFGTISSWVKGVVTAMLPFVYDALLKGQGNEEFVLADIRKNYSYMLEHGATSFWETINGANDFNNAGSLCHGWSAMPVYYMKKLLK